ENFVINEICKTYFNRGDRPPVYHWRDSNQREIDLLLDLGVAIRPIEIKAGTTFNRSYFKHLDWFLNVSELPLESPTVIYGADTDWKAENGLLLSWRNISAEFSD
ncbi:MAG: DUF4143 domain-containing protein, partial [Bacteroidota bacterium]